MVDRPAAKRDAAAAATSSRADKIFTPEGTHLFGLSPKRTSSGASVTLRGGATFGALVEGSTVWWKIPLAKRTSSRGSVTLRGSDVF
jgi:hypothetical protein